MLALLSVVFAMPSPAADEPTKKEFELAKENLKQIGIAFHSYLDEHDNRWADDITDKEGHILLSWILLLLPYICE
jgi:hypothetical protein